MINGELVVGTLKELLKKADSDARLKDVTEKAHRRMLCGGEFPSQLVSSALLGGMRAAKRGAASARLVETSLGCLQHVIHAKCFYPDRRFTGDAALPMFQAPQQHGFSVFGGAMQQDMSSSRRKSAQAVARTIGCVLVETLTELLHTTTDSAVQLKALELLMMCCTQQAAGTAGMGHKAWYQPESLDANVHGELCSPCSDAEDAATEACPSAAVAASGADDDPFGFCGESLCATLDVCFRIAALATNASVQLSAFSQLSAVLRRSVRRFVVSAKPNPAGVPRITVVSSAPLLTNFSTDVQPNEPFTDIRIVAVPPKAATLPHVTKSFSSAEKDPLRDLVAIIKGLCSVASKASISNCSSDTDLSDGGKMRLLALKLLFLVFEELPSANSESEHPCAFWMSVVVGSCKYELLKATGRNVATIAPAVFFNAALDVLRMLLAKVHYHLRSELHSLLNVVLFPLMLSGFSVPSQKLSFLHLMRSIMSTPHLIVAYFINYDCSATFDTVNKHGGMLEAMMDTIVEQAYVEYRVEDDWFTDDHQVLLRAETVRIMHNFVKSLKRWVYEDPREARRRQDEETLGNLSKNIAVSASDIAHMMATELYLDDDTSSSAASDCDDVTADDENNVSTESSRIVDTLGISTNESSAENALTAAAPSSETPQQLHFGNSKRPLPYHWKHVHCILRNKRILQEAAARTNTSWRRGLEYLVEQKILQSEKDYAGFASFLREHPAIERGLLCSVFERVNKDPDCVAILQAYLRTFSFAGVPIDIALRDFTCEFMSWDRPQFEAQVWEKIQVFFGAEYSAQNSGSISERDADVMAGVLLFLHTSVHNSNVKGQNKMTCEQFVRDGSACMDVPLSETAMRDMYARVSVKRWGLDAYQRTPRQQDIADRRHTLNAFTQLGHNSAAIPAQVSTSPTKGRRAVVTSGGTPVAASAVSDTSFVGDGSVKGTATNAQSQPSERTQSAIDSNSTTSADLQPEASILAQVSDTVIPEASMLAPSASIIIDRSATEPTSAVDTVDGANAQRSSFASPEVDALQSPPIGEPIFESQFDSYTDNLDRIRLKQEHEQLFVRVANQHLVKLEASHRRCMASDAPSQPYLVPHYAQHARPIFLSFYSHVVAVCYLGLRLLKQEPMLRLILDIYQDLFDLAAAFCINVSQLQDHADKLVQRCLRQENAVRLQPENIRATLTSFLMNRV